MGKDQGELRNPVEIAAAGCRDVSDLWRFRGRRSDAEHLMCHHNRGINRLTEMGERYIKAAVFILTEDRL